MCMTSCGAAPCVPPACWRLVGAMVGVVGMLVLSRIRRPLDNAVRQAQSLVDGNFVTIAESRVPELQRLTRAMNTMVVPSHCAWMRSASSCSAWASNMRCIRDHGIHGLCEALQLGHLGNRHEIASTSDCACRTALSSGLRMRLNTSTARSDARRRAHQRQQASSTPGAAPRLVHAHRPTGSAPRPNPQHPSIRHLGQAL